ncbi:MAG: IS66 family insertion sequence hypothetical protein, partial [Gemmatimonadetes bacterium]|nr:IS66 family insertion sequence hypothetical protein [Gemmatimonadota bacterium]
MPTQSSKRVRLGRERWQQLLAEQAKSGLSIGAFCEREGLRPATFAQWKRRLRGGAESPRCAPGQENSWLELSSAGSRAPAGDWEIELDLGNGMRLRLRR